VFIGITSFWGQSIWPLRGLLFKNWRFDQRLKSSRAAMVKSYLKIYFVIHTLLIFLRF